MKFDFFRTFLPPSIKKIINVLIVRLKHKGLGCKISYKSKISISTSLEGMNCILAQTVFSGRLGYGSYIANNCNLSADIGRFSSIAPFVRCNYGQHPVTFPFATTAPCFFSLNKEHCQNGSTFATKQMYEEYLYYDKKQKIAVKIGNDCWVGEGAFLVGGIELGDGSVVLAHAVVTKNVPPYAIVGGVPARIIKYRYDDNTIAFLRQIQWWNFPVSWLKENWELLCDIEKLKELYINCPNR